MKRLLFFVALVAMMAAGCQEFPELFDDIINPGQTPSDDNNVNEETIDLLTPDATFAEIPYNEIWYVASQKFEFDNVVLYDELMIVEHFWDDKTGKGFIRTDGDLTLIPSGLFKDVNYLKGITIPNSVTEIGDSAFEGCCQLRSVVIPEGVKSVGNRAFASCDNLEKVTIGFDVHTLGEFVFYGCSQLKSIYLMCGCVPTVGDNLFSDVEGITLYVPRGKKDAYMQNGAWGVMSGIMEEYDYPSLFTAVNLGEGTYIENFFTWLYGVEGGARVSVEIYERVIEPGCYYMKNLFSKENVEAMLGGMPSDLVFATEDVYIKIDATNPEKVWIPFQYTGIGIPDFMDQFWICSGHGIGKEDAKLENGVIEFAAKTVALFDSSATSGYFANPSGMMKIALPGYKIPDYATEIAYVGGEIAPDNSRMWAKFNVSIAEDVTKYRYMIIEGNVPAYETIKEVSGIDVYYRTEQHPAISSMLNAEYINGKPNLDSVDVVARTHFYYIPLGSNEPLPDLCEPVLKLKSVAEVMEYDYYENLYPASFYLAFDIQTDDADLVSKLTWYYSKSNEMPTDLSFEELIALYGVDITFDVSSLKSGQDPYLISTLPDTEYTVILAMSSIYGKTYYYTITGRSAPYYDIAYGVYEFTDGESKMTIEFEPFYNYSYGLMFYMKWIVEDGAPDVKVREYPMVAFTEPDWNAIVCYGQVNGNSSTFFAYDIDRWAGDPNAFWGFHSSSTANYAINNESMVLRYNEDGVIDRLDTYFREYVRVENPDTGVSSMTYVKEFTPNTVVKCIEDKRSNRYDEW